MKACYLIHGIKTGNPEHSTISFFRYLLPDFQVMLLDYGYVPILAAPISCLINYFVIKRFLRVVRPYQILLAHSNGCTVAFGLSNEMPVYGLVLINPALDCDVEFDPRLEFIHIYWSKKDKVTWLSKFVPFSNWGSMGTEGYKGIDPRVRQWEMGISHTAIGSAEIALQWGPLIAANLKETIRV